MRTTSIAVALLVATAACGGSERAPTPGAQGADGADSDVGGLADAAPVVERTTVVGAVHDAVTTSTVAGVSVCVFDEPSSCTTSAADGSFALSGVPSVGSGVVATGAGYATGVFAFTGSSASRVTLSLRPADHAAAWARALGTTFDETSPLGAMAFSVVDAAGNPFAGATVVTVPAGRSGYFAGPGAGIDGARTTTSSSGGGWVYDLPSGTLGVTVSAPGATCARWSVFGWTPLVAGQTLTVPVRAGEVSIVRLVCS